MQLKEHPKYWTLHKKIWEEEYDKLTADECKKIVDDPQGKDATVLEDKVNLIIARKLYV
jgi:hypothetical protein